MTARGAAPGVPVAGVPGWGDYSPAMVPITASPLRVLLTGAIDYAGLFPPAALDMDAAVREFVAARAGADRWALGRFVVPSARLEELAGAVRQEPSLGPGGQAGWGLSALAGSDLPGDLARIDAFRNAHRDLGLEVLAVECRASTPDEATAAAALVLPRFECWVEIPLGKPAGPLLDALRSAGAFPKIRTGGITAEAIPSPEDLVDFLREVVARRLAFKATAGLHHALRGTYRYTYEPGSAVGPMHGYLNLLLATALLAAGGSREEALALLREESPGAFRVGADEVAWRGRAIQLEALRVLRREGLRAFGSCSFREPVDELSLLAPS